MSINEHFMPFIHAMKKRTFRQSAVFSTVTVLVVAFLFASCIAYRPQVVEMPLIHEKGELQVNGSIGLSVPFGDGYIGATASYGATEWLAVQAHANWNGSAGGYGQVATGAFKSWKNAVLEGYIGYGYGGNNWNDKNNGRMFTARYHLPFAQADFGWAGLANGHIDLGVGVKAGCMLPNIVNTKSATESTPESVMRSTSPVALLEPQLFFRVGGKRLKWTLNVGYCHLWGDGSNGEPFANTQAIYMPFTVNTGITYDFNVTNK